MVFEWGLIAFFIPAAFPTSCYEKNNHHLGFNASFRIFIDMYVAQIGVSSLTSAAQTDFSKAAANSNKSN